ncbi:MAG: hydrogenase maturation nickel metallochaperone HypA [Spirochaetales bacterium]|nr:hydrogenase maturation nickel metallochaperone HypA [Candidatus Physcosoma equi]
MHELGVVFHVIESVEKVAKENNVEHISKVTLQLGEVSTVIPHLLEDVWKWAVEKHEVTKGCALDIQIIKALSYCEDCGTLYSTTKFAKVCPKCGSEHTYLKQGNEFTIKDIEVY